MNNHENLRIKGMRHNYGLWREDHPDAVDYDKLLHYIIHGDEFGRPVTIPVLRKLTKAGKTTLLKWLPIIKEEIGKK